MEVEASVRPLVSSPLRRVSLLLLAAVPRQLLLVEVDDHLGAPGAGLAGRQQRHIAGVLPVGVHTPLGRQPLMFQQRHKVTRVFRRSF